MMLDTTRTNHTSNATSSTVIHKTAGTITIPSSLSISKSVKVKGWVGNLQTPKPKTMKVKPSANIKRANVIGKTDVPVGTVPKPNTLKLKSDIKMTNATSKTDQKAAQKGPHHVQSKPNKTVSVGQTTKKHETVWEPPKNPDAKINLDSESSLAYILNNATRCLGDFAKNPSLFIYVESAASDFHRRRVWRSKLPFFQTYGDKKATFMFILALPKDKLTQAKVVSESKMYGDIIQLNYTDDYKALVLKTVAGMRWVMKYCAHAQFIMKTDVDCFVNVHSIFDYLNRLKADKKEYFLGGYPKSWAPPLKKVKWAVTAKQYPYDLYPPYILGLGVLMAKKTLSRFCESALYVKYYIFEDVYIGMLAKAANVNITWVDGFKPYYGRNIAKRLDYCDAKRFKVIHNFSSPKMFEFFWDIFEEFENFGYEC
jgi:hypothetical protein